MAKALKAAPPATAALDVDGWRGELSSDLDAGVFAEVDLQAMLDPDRATEMLYWGARNLLYRLPLASAGGDEAAVKLSRNFGWLRRLQRRCGSSKSKRAWRMALAFTGADVPTPKPLAWVESQRDDGPSLFVTRFEPGLIEVRHVLRSIHRGVVDEQFPWLDPPQLWRACGEVLARLHENGLWHRDASIGNLVVRERSEPLEVLLVDLNRARYRKQLSWSQRMRDLCRLPLRSDADQQALLGAYLGRPPSGSQLALYRLHKGFYFGRIAGKRALRALLPPRKHKRQHPYEHIPRPEDCGDIRGQATWDHLTDQPFQHASPASRRATRLRDAGVHLRDAGRVTASLPKILLRSGSLKRQQFTHPVAWPGVGIALSLGPEAPEQVVELLDEAGAAHVLLRVYPWQRPASEVGLARALAAAGYDLTFALPQNRELVIDLDRWRQAVRTWGRQLAPYGTRFQIGQAINRSKWGVWRSDEYVALVEAAREVLPAASELLGPAVIDFEPLATAVALTQPGLSEPFAVTSSLLYVDRRGAPENLQAGFDAVDKARLMRAIGSATRAGSNRLWVTEVNWPLPAGPHSPAGRAVAVDEQTQANYAVRYYLLLLASGMVERVYWWQMIARGYGLVDRDADGSLRRRPAFTALATLGRQLATSAFERRLPSVPGAHLLQFSTPIGESLIVGWSQAGEQSVDLPAAVEAVFSRDGEQLATPGEEGGEARGEGTRPGTVTLTESPAYYWLRPES